jgi:hypothetical protein
MWKCEQFALITNTHGYQCTSVTHTVTHNSHFIGLINSSLDQHFALVGRAMLQASSSPASHRGRRVQFQASLCEIRGGPNVTETAVCLRRPNSVFCQHHSTSVRTQISFIYHRRTITLATESVVK